MPPNLVLLPTSPSRAQVQERIETTTTLNTPVQDGTVELVERPESVVIPEITPVPRQNVPTTNASVPASKPPATDDTKKTPTTPSPQPTGKPEATPPKQTDSAPSAEELARQQKLIAADKLYMGGQFAAAERIYRQVKTPFGQGQETSERKEPIYDPQKLPPAGKVYWRMSAAGLEQNLETKIIVPLKLLVEKYPEFVPGNLRYAQVLRDYNREAEALQVLERATTLYPNEPDLLRAKIAALKQSKQWLEASLAARQFALLNPTHPASGEFALAADENLERYKSHLRGELRGNTIANVITGALGYAFTGSLFGPLTAVQSTALLLRGESAVGERVANQAKRQLKLVEDKEILDYVREVGNRLATVGGRNDLKYEFYVVMDDKLNAFALPGGKVFVNAGAILHTNSEAELAGLMAHELSHAILSHGFQLATQGNLTANVTQYIPYGGLLGNLIVLDYSRDMERQADILGTRLLASTGYAADGARNLMVTLDKQDRDRPILSWFSSHPFTNERVSYLETLIQRNGYNRYAYEGVARHAELQARVKKLLEESKKQKDPKQEQNRNRLLDVRLDWGMGPR